MLKKVNKVINKEGGEKTVVFSGSRMTNIKTNLTEPYIIKKDTFHSNIPSKDTYVSPMHKIYTDDYGLKEVRYLAKHYKNKIVKSDMTPPYIYYTIVLEDHDSYLANNMPVESMPKENKKMYEFISKNNLKIQKIDKDIGKDL